MAWTPVSSKFQGGTDAARALLGKRIRAIGSMELQSFEPNGRSKPVPLKPMEEGFVGHVPPTQADHVVLAFPIAGPPPLTLDQLQRQQFKTVLVNWPTLRQQFQIDA